MFSDESWSTPAKIAFRFFALYFFLYSIASQLLGLLLGPAAGFAELLSKPFIPLAEWVGAHLFHVVAKPHPTGSGDTMYAWMEAFCVLVIALAGCAVWSILDRRRQRYDRLYRWYRVMLRFFLGSTLVTYGCMKVIPLQMPAPQLTRLLEPYGNFSPMGVLWYSIGASFPYESFVGTVELVSGALLFFPATQLAGALLSLAASTQVFMLNMTYDVPVKLFSFHMVVMSCLLLAPHCRELLNLVFRGRAGSRWAAIGQAVLGLLILGSNAYRGSRMWKQVNGPKPPLYGIWNIERMLIDGVERAPLVTDYDRYRRVVVQNPASIVFCRMDDTAYTLQSKVNPAAKTIALSQGSADAGSLNYDQPSPEELILDGTVKGHTLRMVTRRVDHTRFPLLNRGFNWVQEYPFNR